MTPYEPPEPPSSLPTYPPGESPAYPPPPPLATAYLRQAWPPPAPPRPRRDLHPVDRVATIVLLALGLLGTVVAITTAIALPPVTKAVYERRAEGFFESSGASDALTLMVVGHVALLLIAVTLSLLLLRRKRAAFFLPLIAGVLAAILYWAVFVAYVAADHTMQYVA